MGILFGTDGIRGIANSELTSELALRIGKIATYVLSKESKSVPKILIGTDTRISCDMLESAIVSGICSYGVNAVCAGIIPTPAISHLVNKYNCDAGVMISASHNPFKYNGIKFFDKNGYKLSDHIENEIENIYFDGITLFTPTGDEVGRKSIINTAIDDYVTFLKSTCENDFEGIKAVVDCANGATYNLAQRIFSDLKCNVVALNNQPNGININENCGSTNTKLLQDCVKEHHADIGLAFDGDGDRLIAIDENGNEVLGDQLLGIFGIDLFNKGKLKNNTVVGTIMSNMGLENEFISKDINFVRTKVGDRYIIEEMCKNNYNFGGENSGHIIFRDFSTTGDGILSAIQLLNILKNSNKKMSQLCKIKMAPQIIKNAEVSNQNKNNYLHNSTIYDSIQEIKTALKDNGRLLVRPSGTEPLVRVMIEGYDKKFIEESAEKLANLIENELK